MLTRASWLNFVFLGLKQTTFNDINASLMDKLYDSDVILYYIIIFVLYSNKWIINKLTRI